MSTNIYYFSGTGNSLQVAKDLASGLEGASVQSINIDTDINSASAADAVGLVFPVYAWGLPGLVASFISKLQIKKDAYIFAVTTCGSSPGGTLNEAAKLLEKKGLRLATGFMLKQPSNYIIMYGAEPLEKRQQKILQGHERTLQIIEIVKKRETHKLETSGFVIDSLGKIISIMFRKNAWRQAKSFWADENCNQCQICVRVCPTHNVILTDKLISWGDKCEQCLACLQWCPQEAIQYKQLSQKRQRYHHPDIQVQEMLIMK